MDKPPDIHLPKLSNDFLFPDESVSQAVSAIH